MIVDKEGDPRVREDTPANLTVLFIDQSNHIARLYPRVFLYHYIGLLLLRTPLVAYELNAEILLNFFKIGELITASRTGRKPTLNRIYAATEQLMKDAYTRAEINEFWIVRSRDAAHDYQQSQNIERKLAVDCKLWAEELVVKDWMDRGEPIVERIPPESDTTQSV